MPTNAVTFAPDEIDMVWKEPYLTEGLNEKAMVMPRGVYRGFEVIPSGTALNITVVAALPKNDHLAIVETQNNYSLTIRRATGNFDIDLTAYAAQTVYVTLYATYAIGSTTAAFIRLYTSAEYTALTAAEKAELTILCHVIVPGAGVIPAGAIRFDVRTYPWQSLSPNFLPWRQLVRNGTFELGRTGTGADSAIPYWVPDPSVLPGFSAYFRRSTTDPAAGAACLEYYQDQAGSYSRDLYQFAMIPVVPGQRLVLSFKKKCITVPASYAAAEVIVEFVDNTGAVLGTTVNSPIDLNSTNANYVTLTNYGVVPAGAVAISSVKVLVSALNYAPGGTVIFRLDAVSVLLQASDVAQSQDYGLEAMNQFLHTMRVVLKSGAPDPVGGFAGREAVLLYNDPSMGAPIPAEGQVLGGPVDPNPNPLLLEAPELYWAGVFNVGEYMAFDAARAQRPRILARRADFLIHPRTRIMELPPGILTGGFTVNVYRSWDGAFDERLEICVNAVWNSATGLWNKTFTGVSATRWFVNPFGMQCTTKEAAVAAWSEANWDPAPYDIAGQGGWTIFTRLLQSNNGNIRILNPQTGGTAPSNPTGSVTPNTLYAKNIPKAFGRFYISNVGGVTIVNSFGVLGIAVNPGGNFLVRLLMSNAFASANEYSVVVGLTTFVGGPPPSPGQAWYAFVWYENAAYFNIQFFDNALFIIDPTANATGIDFTVAVFGRQDG